MHTVYSVIYDDEIISKHDKLIGAMLAVKEHPEFYKSKYTRRGKPRSGYEHLKSFWIVDNNGNLYYIY